MSGDNDPNMQGAVCVIGDVIVDHYVWGHAQRLSPEAPVPVVVTDQDELRVGGAALVASHLSALGARVWLCGMVGDDADGSWLLGTLRDRGIDTSGLFRVAQRTTTRKSRIMIAGHHVARFDRERTDLVDDPTWREVLRRLNRLISGGVRLVVVSNYAKGLLSPKRLTEIVDACRRLPNIQVLVDPKFAPWSCLRGATLVKPNQAELVAALGCSPSLPWSEMSAACDALRRQLEISRLVVTLGAGGIVCLSDDGELRLPARRVGVADVTGAGDAVLAGLSWATMRQWPWPERLAFANRCGASSVSQVGTVVLEPSELEDDASAPSRDFPLTELAAMVRKWKDAGDTVVMTNGCFDLLHGGHVHLLRSARKLGTRLVVAVNTDTSVRRLKGDGRPVMSQEERCELLSALRCVDAVVLFEDDTPRRVIEAVVPHVLCKGADYTMESVVGGDVVRANGGSVVLLPLRPGISTTHLITRMIRTYGG